jgi:outer membrane protein OmpA-like peptidoglycan-associated protein
MRSRTYGHLAVAGLACALLLVPAVAEAQLGGFGRRIRDKAKERVEQKEEEAAERAVDAADPATASSAAPAAEAPAASAPGTAASAGGATAAGAAAARQDPGTGAWANYDFVPGERVIFADDFSADRVGNFPRRFEFKSGNMEIVEWEGRRWLRGESGEFLINLPETLPERFTLEFELWGHGNAMQISFADTTSGRDRRVEINAHSAYLRSSVQGEGSLGLRTSETPVSIRIAVDGDYLKLYANEKRALNVPNAKLGRSNRIYVYLNGWSADQPRMIANVRVNAGGRELYDALSADGRVATQGILFDTGSDRIKPESTPTLQEIADMLTTHADLRITIEGHTDNVGNAATNRTLSEQRAAAVKTYLVGKGIDAPRIETAGLGDTKPAAPNTTPEGRQQNRRVELVRR